MGPHRTLVGQLKRVGADGSGFEQADAVAPLDGADDEVEVRRNDAAEEFAEDRSVVQITPDSADGAGAREFGQCFVHGAPLATVSEVRGRTDPLPSRERPDSDFNGFGDGGHCCCLGSRPNSMAVILRARVPVTSIHCRACRRVILQPPRRARTPRFASRL